jgi:hypothetical protein
MADDGEEFVPATSIEEPLTEGTDPEKKAKEGEWFF